MCRVSVVIPFYNRRSTLLRAVDSVRQQTFQDFEIIFVNDGSTDDSEQVVRDYIKLHPEIQVKFISQTNKGPSSARNNGIRNSNGDYIAFLDSDDAWEPEKLEVQINFMEQNPDVAMTGTNYYVVKDRKKNRYSLKPSMIEVNFYYMLFKVVFATPTVIIRKEILWKNNLWFLEGKHHGEDNLLYAQIIRQYRGIRFSIPLANVFKMEYGEDGLTRNINKIMENDLDNLRRLYHENVKSKKKIHLVLYWFLYPWLLLKHFKRILRNGWYKNNSN